MILVDTSVWIDHLRSGVAGLVSLLERRLALTHEFVIGEIACGNLRNRAEVISMLSRQPRCAAAEPAEVLYFIDRHRLMGRGIGYIDVSLLAAAALSSARLWTRDSRLATIARELGRGYWPD